ncbi:17676_t:CDS:2 [Entrophospora sp. SA101]|nr:17676_t:CDS:2 [Entrophospora sp. SA101]
MSEISGSNLASNQSLESVQFTSELSESEEKISSDIIDEGKIAIVSMKKLSFTECANLVMDGIKNDDTDGGELYEGKKIEVINEEVTDNNFSGTTLMTLRTTRTLNDELDKAEVLYGEASGGLNSFGVPNATRKKRLLDKIKLSIMLRDSINSPLKG